MIKGEINMVWFGIISSLVLIVLVLFPVVLEVIARIKNPTPKMNNADKRFIEIENIKTRNMFDIE